MKNQNPTLELFGTLGPSCAEVPILAGMIREGMTGIRLNLSHASLEKAAGLIESYHEAAAQCGVRPELLIDLQGPELRIGELAAPLELPDGAGILLVQKAPADPPVQEGEFREQPGSAAEQLPVLPVARHILCALKAGDHVLFDDGAIEAEVVTDNLDEPDVMEEHSLQVQLRILRGGVLRSRKSLKIIGKTVEAPVLTAQDTENLREAREYGVTSVMQPFVRRGEDLRKLRAAMAACGAGDLRVFAKIESREGAENIEDILPEADMIVIARGDLGNDVPLWELPAVQKEISAACRRAGKPFLVVTQMLQSMIEHPVPTRAETSDIFNAVLDGAAALMLTGETAAGKYPVEAMRYLCLTADQGRSYLDNIIDWVQW